MAEPIEEDFLEVDTEISGQKFTCLSFISPENVLRNKNLFMVHHFLKSVATEYKLTESEIVEKYKTFLFTNESKLDEVFHKENDFQTTVRGVKIRGTYSSLKEAQVRAKRLQKSDPNFNVYVGQVGYWLPWDPSSDNIENQEYANSELNELVHKYNENQKAKEDHFRENIDYVREQEALKVEKKEKLIKEKQEATHKENTENTENVNETTDVPNTKEVGEVVNNLMDSEDPWLSRKSSNAVSNVVTASGEQVSDSLQSALDSGVSAATSASVSATESAVEASVDVSIPMK